MPDSHLSGQSVWAINQKYPGEFGKLVGVFSSVDLAKNCNLIQLLLQEPWRYSDLGGGCVIWQANAIDSLHPNDPFRFSIEEVQVDRLVEFPELSRQ